MEPLPERERTKVRVKSSPQPSPFQGEGERREARMKKIFLIAGLLAVSGNPAAFGQDYSPQTAEGIAAKQELESLKPKLEEYRQGKRDAHDGYVIMFRMLMDYGRLKEGETPEAKALLKEFNLFKKRHPEAQRSVSWVVHSGTMSIIKNNPYTSGENARREVAEKQSQDMAEKRKNFVPADDYVMGVKQQGDRAMAWHQYRIEFYQVPRGMKLEDDDGKLVLKKADQDVPLSHMARMKTMNFVQGFHGVANAIIGSRQDFWVCTQPLDGYTAHTPEEYAILGEGAGDSTVGHIPYWKNPKGTIESFCGILDINGNTVYKLPAKYQPHSPDMLVLPRCGNGKKMEFMVARAVEDMVDGEGLEFGDVREILVWETPDKLHVFNTTDANSYTDESRILKRYGLLK